MTLWLSCNGPSGIQNNFAKADSPQIQYIGRYHVQNDGTTEFSWPGTTVQLSFKGTAIAMKLTDTVIDGPNPAPDVFDIIIDDKTYKPLHAKPGTHTYPLAANLIDGPHTVRIIKRTEGEVGIVQLHGFSFSKGATLLSAPPFPARRLEFIGDSITAGYGNLGKNEHCEFSAATENNYFAYGSITARQLNAMHHTLAVSGRGVFRNYDPSKTTTVPTFYQRAIVTDETKLWDFKKYQPDAVVINLGTNDFGLSAPSKEAFIPAYREFLGSIQNNYPDAVIFIAMGPMTADDWPPGTMHQTTLRTWLKEIISAENKQGNTLDFIEFWGADPEDGYGCQFHPSVKKHKKMADKLTRAIAAKMNWTVNSHK